MKIREIRGYVLAIERAPYKWRKGHPAGGAKRDPFLLQVISDAGLEGYCFAITAADELALAVEKHLKPAVLGADVADRERLWQKLWDMGRGVPSLQPAQAVFDVALWDLAAKRASLPLYQYLGAYRHGILAYASTFTQDSVDDYRRLARDCVERGYRGIKLHLFGNVREDIEACRAVRDEVGPNIGLMIDASAAYNYDQALWAGRQLEKLDFLWFEEPLRDYCMHSLSQLRSKLDIPLCVNETGRDNVFDIANNVLLNTGSIMHSGWQRKSGITGLLKIAHTCEAFGLKTQLHRGEIPNLHVALAIPNCDWFESIVPEDSFHFCLRTPPITPDKDGFVCPPAGAGLGYDIDWDEVERAATRKV